MQDNLDTPDETTRTLYFKVSGEFVTETARDLMIEEGWRKGLGFLTRSLHDMDESMAIRILKGEKRLEGVNDLELVDDTPEAQAAIKARLDYIFKGVFSFENRLWKPYGVVECYGYDDMMMANSIDNGSYSGEFLRNRYFRAARNRLSFHPARSRGIWKEKNQLLNLRSVYYLDNPASDIAVLCPTSSGATMAKDVLCERFEEEPPLWYEIPTDAQAVCTAALESGRLRDVFEERVGNDPPMHAQSDKAMGDSSGLETLVRRSRAARVEDGLEAEVGTSAWMDEKARQERVQETLERMHQRSLEKAPAAIADFANNDKEYGWKEFSEMDEKTGRMVTIRVPGRALICAALSRAKAQDRMPEYSPFSPPSAKLLNDCQYHTDAWLGCGGTVDNAYEPTPEQELFMSKMYEVQRELLSTKFDILARGPQPFVSGHVTHDPAKADKDTILVLREAAPEHADAAMRSAAVIVETGSKVAHLVVVSREAKVGVLRVADALTLFPDGCRVFVSFTEGDIERTGY